MVSTIVENTEHAHVEDSSALAVLTADHRAKKCSDAKLKKRQQEEKMFGATFGESKGMPHYVYVDGK